MGMSGGQKAVIGLALGTGVVLARIPADLVIPFLGLELGSLATAYGAYQSIPALRDGLDDLAARARAPLAPRPRRSLPAPAPSLADMEVVLSRLLDEAEAADRDAAQARTGTTQLVLRAAAPATALARPAPPAPRAVLITYHPELGRSWADDPANAPGVAALGALVATPFDAALATLLHALGLHQARVGADSSIGQTSQTALTLVITDMPLDEAQRAVLAQQAAWWRPYASGRVRGLLVALRTSGQPAPEAPARPGITYDDLDALDAIDTEHAPTPIAALAPTPMSQTTRPIPPARPEIDRGPDHPVARIVGAGAIPTVAITVGRAPSGAWHYAPLKHGLIAKGTGGGKTNLLDLILGQLQALQGVEVWFGTAKPFVTVDPSDRLDRRPLIAHLPEERVATDADAIMGWLWRATAAMNQRYKDMQANPGWFPQPFVVIFDEVKAYFEMIDGQKVQQGGKQIDQARVMGSCLKQLLILARECGGSLVFTSQDGYCGSLKLSRGELGNLGFRAIHPSLDPNSIANLLPEGLPPMIRAGKWDWLIATEAGVDVVAVPRVSQAMFKAWGLLAAESEAESEESPAVDDTALLRWAVARHQAGEMLTLTGAAAHFGVELAVMRDALVRNGMLEGQA